MIAKLKERHLYFYTCSKCGVVNRCSFKRSVARGEVCRKCRNHPVNENQMSLIPNMVIQS